MDIFSLCTRCILPHSRARLLETDPETQVVRLINLAHVTADKTACIYACVSCNILASHYTLGNRAIRGQLKGHKIRGRSGELHKGPLAGVCVCNVNNVFQRLVLSGSASVHTQSDESIRSNRIPKKRISLAISNGYFFFFSQFLRRRCRSEEGNEFPF